MRLAYMLAAFGVSVICGGCTLPYKEAEERTSAALRIVAPGISSSGFGVGAYTFENDRCDGQRKIWGTTSLDFAYAPKTLNMPTDRPLSKEEFTEVRIPTDQRFNIGFDSAGAAPGGRLTCQVTISFLPQTGKLYEVMYKMTGYQCGVTVHELRTTEDGMVQRNDVDSARNNPMTCRFFLS